MSKSIEIFMKRFKENPDPFSKVPSIEPGLKSVVWESRRSTGVASSITIDERDGFYFSATYVNNGIFQEIKLDKNEDGTFTRRITTPRPYISKPETNAVQMYGTAKDLISPDEARKIVRNSILNAKRI